MEKVLISGAEARARVKAGVDKGADAVKGTLGPFGTNGLIEKGLRITNDGATILREITLEDEVENMGLSKLKEAVAKSNDQVGDGSTTIAVLVQSILKISQSLLGSETSVGRMTTADFLKKLKSERDEIIEKLIASAAPITTEEQLINSAIVSVESEEIGRIIGSTQWELGEGGYMLAEEVPENGISVEKIHGIRIDNGLGATQMFNNPEKQMLEVEDVPVIITDHTLQSIQPLKDLIESVIKTRKVRRIAIIARGFSNEAIQDVGMNLQNGIEIYPINAPYTDSREVLLDLSAVLGGKFIDHEIHSLEDAQLSDVGFAAKIRARRFDAIITGKTEDDAHETRILERIDDLYSTLKGSESDFEKKNLTSRIAQLEHGFALIKVGAESETERKRIFDKVEDAVNAVRAALQEGTVKGAGLAFKEIADTLPEDYILKRPLDAIHTQILANAPVEWVVEDWIRDPIKVLRIALEQAVSVAGDLATVSVAIATKKETLNAYIKNEST